MSALLVLTVGQTDVQLVRGDTRSEFKKEVCAALHDEIERRAGAWSLVPSPVKEPGPLADQLPADSFKLCTPKLDAVWGYLAKESITVSKALILETRREPNTDRGEPRFAGELLRQRLLALGVPDVERVAYLSGRERLEDRDQPRDAVMRREVVGRIEAAVRGAVGGAGRVVVAPTGGLPAVSGLVEEVVRLLVDPGVAVDLLEVADGAKANPPTEDRAVPRRWVPEPAMSYQVRRHALELIERGNLLGAWGAVQHLDADEVERRWTRVVGWLACFAASTPMPDDCDLSVLRHPRMAVRAALRVELALRAGDVPRAVHGTVAFFESALWDHMGTRVTRHVDPKKRRIFTVDPDPHDDLVRAGNGSDEDRRRPFERVASNEFRIYDDEACANRLAKHFLKRDALLKLGQAVSKVRDLRNDVAHNEPTPAIMDDARCRMLDAGLWSASGSFLAQDLIKAEMADYGVGPPEALCDDLIAEVRARLVAPGDGREQLAGTALTSGA